MALSEVTTTLDLHDLLGVAFDVRRTKVTLTTNAPKDAIHDTSTGKSRIGGGSVTLNADGVATATTWAPGADGNPATWQTTFHVDYMDSATRQRVQASFGPYTITTSGNLTDLEEEQVAIPTATASDYADAADESATAAAGSASSAASSATDAETAQTAAEDARDGAVAIVGPVDSVVAGLVANTGGVGPLTSAELSATVARKDAAPLSVKEFGAVGDGVTDDTQAVQDALDAAAGGTVYFPPGIYATTATLVLTPYTTLSGAGANNLYPNFTTDWQTSIPSWGLRASTIQRLSGHGAIFNDGTNCEFDGLVLRHGGSRTSDDIVFAAASSHYRFTNNVVQNLHAVGYDNSVESGAVYMVGNQFTGCSYVMYGILVDCRVLANTFTSLSQSAFRLTNGAGINIIQGNRFEFCEAASVVLETGARFNVINGNVFDAHAGPAVEFLQCLDPNSVVGNLFWRNGRAQPGGHTDCHIRFFASSGQTVNGNTYRSGGPDGGGATWSGPASVIGLESCSGLKNKFQGNITRQGCTTSRLVVDRYDTSTNCLEFDSLDLPAGAAPGSSTSDDLAVALSKIGLASVREVPVFIHENRYATAYVSAAKVVLVGAGTGTRTITNGSGGLNNLAGVDKITYAGRVYTIVGGAQYADGQPDGFRGNGGWPTAKRVYNATPAAGGTEGWMLTAQGSPDTWKAFGSIAP